MKKDWRKKEEMAEDVCFICKDGGELLVCDFKHCLKAYHTHCVEKEPTFLETEERYICSWHSCFICHKSSKYHCFCCPNAVCQECDRAAEFIHLKKKGFCNHCLKLALLIEKNKDIDSDGDKVDFNDSETYEFLFRDYWEEIKEKEKLTLKDLETAYSLLKKGELSKSGTDSDRLPEDDDYDDEELISDIDDMENIYQDDGILKFQNDRRKVSVKKRRTKKSKSKGMEFSGWGSKPLLDFLISIGKDISNPLTQMEVHDILREYILENNLFKHNKKRTVKCDARLHSLFGRKILNRLKISDLLENHFKANQGSDDELEYESADEVPTKAHKRHRSSSSHLESHKYMLTCNIEGKAQGTSASIYACITVKNIKLVYLRRSLVMEFLKNPETFNSKVTDCFVKVRTDEHERLLGKLYKLMQITGIKNASEAYKTGDTSTDIVLQVSNMEKDIRICMISDDDISQEECDELRERVKKGLLKRPTVAEVLEKAKALHEDITNHRIEKEILMLQNLITRANEKGWRRELMEYVDKITLLRSPEERLRQLQQLPSVVADAETEVEYAIDYQNDGEIEEYEAASKISEKQQQDLTLQAQQQDLDDENTNHEAGKSIPGTDEKLNSEPENSQQSNISKEKKVDPIAEKEKLWHYIDPSGTIQGPFSMYILRKWYDDDYLPDDFKIWRKDQTQEQAILLTDLL